jgi:hypothetical protein
MKTLIKAAALPLALSTLFAGCSQQNNLASASAPKRLSDDFYVTVVTKGQSLPMAAIVSLQPVDDKQSCEQSLTRAACSTTASAAEITSNYSSIRCAADSAQFVPALMDIYEEMPARMRVSLCSLDRIFISDGITSTAFASSVTDEMGSITGGFVGMRKGTFLAQPKTSQLVTWKEQLAFGGSTQFLANDPKLVQMNYDLKMSTLKSDGLFYVLMHELGHLIDFNNHVNSPQGMDTAWSKLSWANSDSPLASATFLKRDDFCFYNCSSYLDPRDAKAIYSSLAQSSFVTTYAASNPYEDFAENWAWHMMEQNKNPDYQITVPGEGVVDMNQVFKANAKIQKKIEFIDVLWNRTDLQIDNRVGGH